jgi:hypothetical protein
MEEITGLSYRKFYLRCRLQLRQSLESSRLILLEWDNNSDKREFNLKNRMDSFSIDLLAVFVTMVLLAWIFNQ